MSCLYSGSHKKQNPESRSQNPEERKSEERRFSFLFWIWILTPGFCSSSSYPKKWSVVSPRRSLSPLSRTRGWRGESRTASLMTVPLNRGLNLRAKSLAFAPECARGGARTFVSGIEFAKSNLRENICLRVAFVPGDTFLLQSVGNVQLGRSGDNQFGRRSAARSAALEPAPMSGCFIPQCAQKTCLPRCALRRSHRRPSRP